MRHLSAATVFTIVSFNLLVLFLPVAILLLWRNPRHWVRLLTIFLGMIVGLLDLHSSEVQMTALLLLVFGFFTGFAEPSKAWLSAILLAMWIPIITVAALFAGAIHGQPFGVPATMFAFFPALVGAYLGVLVQRFGRRSEA